MAVIDGNMYTTWGSVQIGDLRSDNGPHFPNCLGALQLTLAIVEETNRAEPRGYLVRLQWPRDVQIQEDRRSR